MEEFDKRYCELNLGELSVRNTWDATYCRNEIQKIKEKLEILPATLKHDAYEALRSFEKSYLRGIQEVHEQSPLHLVQYAPNGDVLDIYIKAGQWLKSLCQTLWQWSENLEKNLGQDKLPAISAIEVDDNGYKQSVTFYPFDGHFKLSVVAEQDRKSAETRALNDSLREDLLGRGIPKELLFRRKSLADRSFDVFEPRPIAQVWNDIGKALLIEEVVSVASKSAQFSFLNSAEDRAEWEKSVFSARARFVKYTNEQLLVMKETVTFAIWAHECAEKLGVTLGEETRFPEPMLAYFFTTDVMEWERPELFEMDVEARRSSEVSFQNDADTAALSIYFRYDRFMSVGSPSVALGIRVFEQGSGIDDLDSSFGFLGELVVSLITKARDCYEKEVE